MSTTHTNAVKTQSTVGKPAEGVKVTPATVDTFNIKKFKIQNIDMNSTMCKTQFIGFSDYDGKPFTFQTPEFKITQYGVPTINTWLKTEDEVLAAGISLPSDNQPGCMLLKQKIFKPLDDYLGNKNVVLGREIIEMCETPESKTFYTYKPILIPPTVENKQQKLEREKAWLAKNKDLTKMVPKCDKWKVKLNIPFGSKKIDTIVFVRDPDNLKAPPRKVAPANMEELYNVVPWGSTVQMIVQIKKLWADKAPMKGSKDLSYGITFKVMQILSTPLKRTPAIRNDFTEYAFVDPNVEKETLPEQSEQTEQVPEGDGSTGDSDETVTGSESGQEPETEIIPEPLPPPKPEVPKQAVPKQPQLQQTKPIQGTKKMTGTRQ